MISQRAKTGFNQLLTRCLEESLRTESYPAWKIQPVNVTEIGAKKFIMLTISSYDFRLIVLLHFSPDSASIKYVTNRLKIASGELPISQYQDYLSEVGNILCGAIKRGLFQSFPHLGMSSPNQLDCESLRYIETYAIDYAIHIKAKAEDGTEFYGSLYVSSIGELDFDPAGISTIEDKVEMGALELF